MLFVDVGYSSYQVSVVDYVIGKLTVKSTTYDRTLGGRDFDMRVAEWIAAEFRAKHKCDPMSSPKPRMKLLDAAEKGNQKKTKKGPKDMHLMKIDITDADFMGMWTVPSSWPTPFSTAPKSLSEFLDFLLNEKNVTEPGIVCHKLEVTAEGETKITQETPCCFLSD